MKRPVVSLLRVCLVGVMLVLTGCPSGQTASEEEKEPHFLAGKSRVNAMDYRGAVESFQKALEINPRSGAAHFELAWLFERKDPDPAAAIYHYERYLKFRPRADNADIVRQRILACKQELARTVSLGPVTERQQREMEKLADENKRLLEENKRLTDELTKWRAQQVVLAAAGTNSHTLTTTGAPMPRSANPAGRTYVVKSGDTLVSIARIQRIKLDALTAANPGVDPKRLRVGQTLQLP